MERMRTLDVVDEETKDLDFASMFLSPRVTQGLKESGFRRPSPIQLKAIPLGRLGLDLIAQAKGGTGKTLVFAVIALEMVDVAQLAIQVIILAPTREIAMQSAKVITDVGRFVPSIQCHAFIGGHKEKDHAKQCRKCHVVVGSPGRVQQLIDTGALPTEKVRLFVLDEADRLSEGNMQVQCNEIFRALPQRKQTCAFSATYSPAALDAVRTYMRDPVFICLVAKDRSSLHGVREYFQVVTAGPNPLSSKKSVLIDLLGRTPFYQCVVFCNEQTTGEDVAATLTAGGLPSKFISGKQEQSQRTSSIRSFAKLAVRVLVSTDLTSRGIDMSKVNLVVNLDVPLDPDTYTHRTGRTGRFGTFGLCVNLLTGSELQRLRGLRQRAGAGTALLPLPAAWSEGDLHHHRDLEQSLDDKHREILAKFESKRQEAAAHPPRAKRRRLHSDPHPKIRNSQDEPADQYVEDFGEDEGEDPLVASSCKGVHGAETDGGIDFDGDDGLDGQTEDSDADEVEEDDEDDDDGESDSGEEEEGSEEQEEQDAVTSDAEDQRAEGVTADVELHSSAPSPEYETAALAEPQGSYSETPPSGIDYSAVHTDLSVWPQVQLLHQTICQYYDAHYYRCYCAALQQATGGSPGTVVLRDYAAELLTAIQTT